MVDGAPPHIRRVTREGNVVWAVGGAGEGPGEFDSPVDAAVLDGVGVAVLDIDLGRITVVDQGGRTLSVFRVPAGGVGEGMIAVGDSLVVASSYPPAMSRTTVSAPTEWAVDRLAWTDTFPSYARLHRRIAGDGGRLVTAFKAGPGFFVHSADSVVFHPFVEPRPIQMGNVRADEVLLSARAVDVRGDSIYVLYGGRTAYPRGESPSLIDVYGFDGSYSHSYRLPYGVRDMILDGDGFIVLLDEPAPGVVRLKPR